MVTHSVLIVYNSRREKNGNCGHAFCFHDCMTGKVVYGRCTGESNILSIRNGWSVKGEWDKGILIETKDLPIREFNRMTNGWKYAGCRREDLQAWIKGELVKGE